MSSLIHCSVFVLSPAEVKRERWNEYFVKWFCTSDGNPHRVLPLLSALSLCHHCHSAGTGQDLTFNANATAGAISLLKGCPFKFTPMIVNLHIWADCFREALTSLTVDIPGLSSLPLVLPWFLWCVHLKFSYTYPWDMKQSVGCLHVKSFQSCPTLCNPMHCSPPGSSVHGILQARILVWVAISSSRGSSPPRDRTWVSCVAGRLFIAEPAGKPKKEKYLHVNPESCFN